jgi:hypothetical protein
MWLKFAGNEAGNALLLPMPLVSPKGDPIHEDPNSRFWEPMHPDHRPYFHFTGKSRFEKSVNSLLGLLEELLWMAR